MDLIGASPVLLVGLALLVGYAAHVVGSRAHIPRVTLLLLLGFLCSPSVFNLVPAELAQWFPEVAHFALAIVGFLLGESFAGKELRNKGGTVFWVSLGESLMAAIAVFVCLLAFGTPLVIALLLAGIAPASAPAATLDVVRENEASGLLTHVVLGVVAIDDAWGIILFSLILTVVEALIGSGSPGFEVIDGIWEVLGAMLVGFATGVPMAWVTGKLREGEPALAEAMGFIFLCCGFSILIGVPYLLACMVLGVTVARRAEHYTRPFHEIEGVSEPFLVVFFLLAGFGLDLAALAKIGPIGLIYVLARSFGKILGGAIGATVAKAPLVVRKHVGWCLLPQAGIALGLALLVSERVPEIGAVILPLIIGTTVVFEIVGPLSTQWHLRRAGEVPSRGN